MDKDSIVFSVKAENKQIPCVWKSLWSELCDQETLELENEMRKFWYNLHILPNYRIISQLGESLKAPTYS